MSVITGVGDEVVEVVCLLVAAAVALLAWWSTAARPERFRTVIVMERTARATPHQLTIMGRNIRRHLSRGSLQLPASPVEPEPTGSAVAVEAVTDAEWDGTGAGGGAGVGAGAGSEPEAEEAAPAVSAQAREMDRIVDAMDADINVLRHRRLNFFTRTNSETTVDSSNLDVPASRVPSLPGPNSDEENCQSKQCDAERIGGDERNKIADEASHKQNETGERRQSAGDVALVDDEHKVNIKLKYLNDTFREVDGNLEELLKDFKWRHFPRELSGNCRVLLIYNGHVLADEGNTLRACGLHHNSVVHCLVHPPRNQRGAGEVVPSLLEEAGVGGGGDAAEEAAGAPAEGAPPAEPRSWDLENVLMTLVSIVLTIIWFFRCEYSNMFTASASGALFALTIFYSIAIFGLYFSDTFQLAERRTAAPPPAPAAPAPPRDLPAHA